MKRILALTLCAALAVPLAGCGAASSTSAPASSSANSAQPASYQAGTYTGVGTGMDGAIKLDVTFSDSAITDIQIQEQNETAGICEWAYDTLLPEIIEYQSLAVDSVSGATITSAGIKSAIADAVAQAGGDTDALRKAEVPSKAEDAEYEYDVVVVGGGLSGLMSAIRAAKSGANVALIEKTGVLGGSSVTASGNFACAETEEHIQPMYDAWMQKNATNTRNTVEEDMLQALCDVSPDVIAELRDDGVEFTITTVEATGSQTFVCSASEKAVANAATIQLASAEPIGKGGEQLIKNLTAICEKVGVTIYLNTPGTQLLTDDTGAVVGVVSESKKYGTRTFHAGAVVLCTGDYAKNAELTAQINPRAAGEFSATAVGNTGDGIQMALAVGGVLDEFQESMSGVFTADPYNMPTIGQKFNSYPFEAVVLTMDGQRVFREDGGCHQQMVHYIRDDDLDTAWCVMDQKIADSFINLEQYLAATEKGHPAIKAYKADSLDELAALTGMDAATLNATIAQYNALAEQGEDTDRGKDAKYLDAIEEGPFYAVLLYNATRGNYGGIVTSPAAEVVDADGNAIAGLYAGGILSSGAFFADYYAGGEALAVAANMGYISGENAAAYALNQ